MAFADYRQWLRSQAARADEVGCVVDGRSVRRLVLVPQQSAPDRAGRRGHRLAGGSAVDRNRHARSRARSAWTAAAIPIGAAAVRREHRDCGCTSVEHVVRGGRLVDVVVRRSRHRSGRHRTTRMCVRRGPVRIPPSRTSRCASRPRRIEASRCSSMSSVHGLIPSGWSRTGSQSPIRSSSP